MRFLGYAGGLVLALAPMALPAATVTVGPGTASWSSDGFTYELQGQGTKHLSWGRPHADGGGQQSYYDFVPAALGTSAPEETNFLLGTFTHGNFAIRGSADDAIESASLDFKVELAFDLGSAVRTQMLDFDWLFLHNESMNYVASCANGGANWSGINKNGCADYVTFNGSGDTYEFAYAEGLVTLEILGFQPGTNFWTVENEANVTSLYGRFSFTPAVIPLPAAGWLLLSALGALALARRRAAA